MIELGQTEMALAYEVADMEAAVRGLENRMQLGYTRDVIELMTQIRNEWGLGYPEEE